MFPFRRACATLLGAALLLTGCGAPTQIPADPPSVEASGSTSPAPQSGGSSGPSDALTGSIDPNNPSTETDSGAPKSTDLATVAARVAIDLSVPAPKMPAPNFSASEARASAQFDFSGNLLTGGDFTVSLQPGQSLAITVTATEPITTVTQLDGSVPILVGAEFRLGFGAPQIMDGSDSSDPTLHTEILPADAQSNTKSLTILVALSADSPPTTVSIAAGSSAATAATWNQAEGGKSLQVTPSAWGRSGGLAVMEYGWPSVLELIGTKSEANSDSMRNQFQCHAIGAPNKETWNLEPWRPDVGLLKFMAARCNP